MGVSILPALRHPVSMMTTLHLLPLLYHPIPLLVLGVACHSPCLSLAGFSDVAKQDAACTTLTVTLLLSLPPSLSLVTALHLPYSSRPLRAIFVFLSGPALTLWPFSFSDQ